MVMKNKSRILLLGLIGWPIVCTVIGLAAAVISGEHGSILFLIWGLLIGVAGTITQTCIKTIFGRFSIESNLIWLYVAISTLLLFGLFLAYFVWSDGGDISSINENLKYALTFWFIPALIVSYGLEKISKSWNNP